MAVTMARFFPGATVPVLADALSPLVCPADKTWKVHVEYDGTGILLVRTEEYHIRTIRSLRLVCCNDITYAYKSADRRRLAALAALRGDADEVVIVRNTLGDAPPATTARHHASVAARHRTARGA